VYTTSKIYVKQFQLRWCIHWFE